MNFFDLNAGNFREYIAQNQSSQNMWVFHHIPKTAGSSLASEMAAHAQPFKNVDFFEYDGEPVPFTEQRDRCVSKLISDLSKGEIYARSGEKGMVRHSHLRSFCGHFMGKHLDEMEASFGPLNCFTFLRDPVKRVLSEYNYCCSPLHPPHAEFRARFPSIEHFAHDEWERNKISQYLLPEEIFPSANIPWSKARSLLARRYNMIGLQERYPLSFMLMSSLFFGTRLPEVSERVSAEKASIDPGLAQMITQANELDMHLFVSVSHVYDAIGSAMWDWYENTYDPTR